MVREGRAERGHSIVRLTPASQERTHGGGARSADANLGF
jgi:hypothetical protein